MPRELSLSAPKLLDLYPHRSGRRASALNPWRLRLVLKPCRHPDHHRLWDLKINAPWTIRTKDFCSQYQIIAEDYWSLSTDCFEDGLETWLPTDAHLAKKRWSNRSPISFCRRRDHGILGKCRCRGGSAVGSTPVVVQCLWCWEIYRRSMVSFVDYIYWIVDYHPITMDLSVLLIIIINFKSPCSIPVIWNQVITWSLAEHRWQMTHSAGKALSASRKKGWQGSKTVKVYKENQENTCWPS